MSLLFVCVYVDLLLFLLLVRHNTSLLVFALFFFALWNSFWGCHGFLLDTEWYRNTEWNRVIQIGATLLEISKRSA